MLLDITTFIILHIPFIVVAIWCFVKGKNKKHKTKLVVIFSIGYLVTLISYLFDLGDDFAFIQYFSNYILVPIIAFIVYFEKSTFILIDTFAKIIGFTLLLIMMGFVSFVFAIFLNPPSFL